MAPRSVTVISREFALLAIDFAYTGRLHIQPKRYNAMSRHEPRAFTLVELLVVIGIIALFISILLPSLNRAREQAKIVQCLSNLRQLGQANAMYAVNFKGFSVLNDYGSLTGATDSGGTVIDETWFTLFVTQKLIDYPFSTDTTTPPGGS